MPRNAYMLPINRPAIIESMSTVCSPNVGVDGYHLSNSIFLHLKRILETMQKNQLNDENNDGSISKPSMVGIGG